MRPTLATTLLVATLCACDAIGEANLFQLTGPPRPPLEELRAAWTYERPDRYVHYTGLADEQGHLYWLECNDCRNFSWAQWCSADDLRQTPDSEDTFDPPQQLKCELVSAEASGTERWRVPTGLASIGGVALGPDEVVLVGFQHVYVHDRVTGMLRWSQPIEPARESTIVGVGGGRLVLRQWQDNLGRLSAFDLGDGSPLFATAPRSDRWWAWTTDEQGLLVARSGDRSHEGSLAAHAGGDLLWSIEAAAGPEGQLGSPVATAGGRTLLARPTAVLRNEDGVLFRDAAGENRVAETWWKRIPIQAVATSGYALQVAAGPGSDGRLELRVARISLDSGATDWETLVAEREDGSMEFSTPLLTADGGVLFSWSARRADSTDWESRLVLVGADGAFRVSRKLPGPGRWTGGAVLHDGLWIAAHQAWRYGGAPEIVITAWQVGSLQLAPAGWVSSEGSPRRNHQALPAR